MEDTVKALLAEFIGTFTLVLIGCGAVALAVQQGFNIIISAFAFGLVLLALVYTWGSYSGAHLNPAISFGFAVAGRMPWLLMLGYWIAQILGAILAAALVAYFFGTASGAGASVGILTNTDAWKAVLVEAFITFFLVLTVLFVTRSPMLSLVSGLAIGLIVVAAMLAFGYLTGASMNPARSLGPAIFSGNMGTWWIYVVGPLLGALVAALIFRAFDSMWCAKVCKDECGRPIVDACGNKILEYCEPIRDRCGNICKDPCGKALTRSIQVIAPKFGWKIPFPVIGDNGYRSPIPCEEVVAYPDAINQDAPLLAKKAAGVHGVANFESNTVVEKDKLKFSSTKGQVSF